MDDALAAKLAGRMERDQTTRTAVQRHALAEAVDRLVEVDNENPAWLRGVLDRVGWPGPQPGRRTGRSGRLAPGPAR